MKAVKVKTNCSVEIVDVKNGYPELGREIGADLVEVVRIVPELGVPKGIVMLVDEEGLLKEKPVCNPVASCFYGTLNHGHPIMGDVLLISMNSSGDFVSIPDDLLSNVHKYSEFIGVELGNAGFTEHLHELFDGKTIQHFPPTVVSFDTVEELGQIFGLEN